MRNLIITTPKRMALGAATLATAFLGACAAASPHIPPTTTASGGHDESSTSSANTAAAPSADTGQCQLTPVYFAYDSNELDPRARTALEHNAECIKRSPEARAVVVGMTDPRGSEEYNLALGERRAQSAIRYLAAFGVEATRLDSRSNGEEYATGADESGWERDRRADVSTP